MASKDIDIKLKLDAKDAAKGLDGISKQLDDLDDPTEVKVEADTSAAEASVDELATETKTAAQEMADAIRATADQAAADFRSMAAASDAVAQSLGPEMVAKIERTGSSIDEMVADLHKGGVAFDDIKADANEFADAIRHATEVGETMGTGITNGAARAEKSIQRMKGEADQSRSVLANMAGNTTQDLANISGAAGTAGLALGQFAEYATEGNISLGGLAKVAGPMAALTVTTMALTQGSKQAAAAEKDLAKQIDALSTASDEAALKSLTQIFLDQFIAGKSLAGVWKQMAEDNIEGARRMHDLMLEAGVTTEQVEGLTAAIETEDAKTAQAAATHEKYGDAVAATGSAAEVTGEQILEQSRNADLSREAAERATEWEEKHARELENVANASKSLTEQLDKQRQKQQDVTSAERAAVDTKYAYRQATKDADEATANYNEVLGNNKSKQEDIEAATDNALGAILDQSGAYATLNGAALDSKDGIDRQIDSLVLTASTLAPGSPLRVAIDEYIKDLQNIPTEINTKLTVTATGGGAVLLRNAGRGGTGIVFDAEGTTYAAGGPTVVGERGPELINLPTGSQVIPNHELKNYGSPVTIIQNFPPGINPLSVAKANKEYQRRGGR